MACQYLGTCQHGHVPPTAVCSDFCGGMKANHCVYCDHSKECHAFFNAADFEKHR
jgi:hypothetical protein